VKTLKHREKLLGVKLAELQAVETSVNEDLEELELVSWKDKLELETSRCSQLETDVKALTSSLAESEVEVGRWQQRVEEITAEMESVRSNSQQKEADKMRLKEKVAGSRLYIVLCAYAWVFYLTFHKDIEFSCFFRRPQTTYPCTLAVCSECPSSEFPPPKWPILCRVGR